MRRSSAYRPARAADDRNRHHGSCCPGFARPRPDPRRTGPRAPATARLATTGPVLCSGTLMPPLNAPSQHGQSALDHLRAYIRHPCDRDTGLCGADRRRSNAPDRPVVFLVRDHRAGFPDGQLLSGAVHRETGRNGYCASDGQRAAHRFSALPAERHRGEHCRRIPDPDFPALFQPRRRTFPGEPLNSAAAGRRLQSRRRQLSSRGRTTAFPPQRHATDREHRRVLESHRAERGSHGDLDGRCVRVAVCGLPETRPEG